MPVSFNEPLTLLQKCAEEIEYYDLLSQAAHSDDPLDRMCLVAAFAVSTYANTKHRTGRKGLYVDLSTLVQAAHGLIYKATLQQPNACGDIRGAEVEVHRREGFS